MSRILIADDAPFFRMMLKDIFEKAGHDVTLAEDGEQTVQIVSQNPGHFDLLVLDMVMPKKTGVEVLMDLEEYTLNILCVTGNDMVEEGQDLIDLGAKSFINKSTPVEEIIYEANQLLFMADQNQTERTSSRVLINLQVRVEASGQQFTTNTFTISENGLFVQGNQFFEKGTQVHLTFFVPLDGKTGKEIQCNGEIVWVQNQAEPGKVQGMGIRFLNLNPFDHQMIKDFIAKNLNS